MLKMAPLGNLFSKFSGKNQRLIVYKKTKLKKNFFDQELVFHVIKKLHKFH